MNRLVLPLVLSLFLPTLVCQADMAPANATPNTNIPPELLNKQNPENLPPRDSIALPFAFSQLTLSNTPVPKIKIAHSPQKEGGISFSLVRNADADVEPVENFEKICNAVNDARRLDDLKMFLSENNFQALDAKVKAGDSQYVILAMIQSMRPENIHVIDSDIRENRAELAVTGKSPFGPMQGIVHLVKTEGVWKIENEDWYAVDKNPMATASNRWAIADKNAEVKSSDLFPDHKFNRNFLGLTKVPYTKENRAFTFVFLMSKQKVDPDEAEGQVSAEVPTSLAGKPRGQMHILWTGSKKMMTEQRLIKNEYPVDVSMAQYDEGYAAGEWNLILPKKKPRGIQFSLLWSF